MLAPLGEHPFQVYGLFHMWKNGKEQFCNTKGKGGIELPVWGGGIVDIYHVIVLMVSSNLRPVWHRSVNTLSRLTAFSICGKMENSRSALQKVNIYKRLVIKIY